MPPQDFTLTMLLKSEWEKFRLVWLECQSSFKVNIFYKYNFLVLFSYLFYGVYEEQKFCKTTDFNLGVVLDRIVFDIFKVQAVSLGSQWFQV